MIAIVHSFMSNLSSPVQDGNPRDSRKRRHMPCTQGANSPGGACKARDAHVALCCPIRGWSGSGVGLTLGEGPARSPEQGKT